MGKKHNFFGKKKILANIKDFCRGSAKKDIKWKNHLYKRSHNSLT